ncbi:helix-turn-helix domain-containing protein [Microvirga roseola]|uniref:helix-turn-helix domain-containing protein n=1 Tax=Microvirga roseola TaxID=2883126 RepID=UPI0022A8934D|nr:helix-turn-helix domain-containing protein [Microvirga roseola]
MGLKFRGSLRSNLNFECAADARSCLFRFDPSRVPVEHSYVEVTSRPLVPVPLGAKLLKVTPKAVDLMLAQLRGARPRELTGHSRYRAWGIVLSLSGR